MLDLVSKFQGFLVGNCKVFGSSGCCSILISMLFGTGVPFFGGILENTQNVIALLGSEGLGLIIAIIIILSVWNSRSS